MYIGEAQDGMEAVEKAQSLASGRDPDGRQYADGWAALRRPGRVKREFPHIGVVALTMYEEQQYIFDLVRAGATGLPPERFRIVADCSGYSCDLSR